MYLQSQVYPYFPESKVAHLKELYEELLFPVRLSRHHKLLSTIKYCRHFPISSELSNTISPTFLMKPILFLRKGHLICFVFLFSYFYKKKSG